MGNKKRYQDFDSKTGVGYGAYCLLYILFVERPSHKFPSWNSGIGLFHSWPSLPFDLLFFSIAFLTALNCQEKISSPINCRPWNTHTHLWHLVPVSYHFPSTDLPCYFSLCCHQNPCLMTKRYLIVSAFSLIFL